MTTNHSTPAGNGETVIICLSGTKAGQYLRGRLFRAAKDLFDLLDGNGRAHRVGSHEIAFLTHI